MSGSDSSSVSAGVLLVTGAAAVACYYLFHPSGSSSSQQTRRPEETQALRQRMQAAAETRLQSSSPLRKVVNKPKKKTRTGREGKTEKKDVVVSLTKKSAHTSSSSGLPKPSNGPRKATLAEELKDREEKISNEQFGFSIYGNQEYCQSCGTNSAPTMVTSSSSSSFGLGIHRSAVISNLPGVHHALQELERLRDEFEPVVRARGWKVLLLTEMCCCGDGDGSTSSRQDDTVLGYCVSANDNRAAHSIHIRLRRPGSCQGTLRLYPYKELVQTMCHELAHIAVGPHNGHFFKVMAEIEDEHAQQLLLAEQTSKFPGSGRCLGTI